MKSILGIHGQSARHWVGDGFPVRSLFSYTERTDELSPFLLLDYAGPHTFAPTAARRGVGEHPHRGFETVTIVYQGEVAHRDSTGAGGLIGPGDVQWMTAGAGILHEEFHAPAFARNGGTLEMVQLWVNLPARDKMAAPGYQTLLERDIPVRALPGDAGTLRVIAGAYEGTPGPARTHSPIDVWDMQITQHHHARLNIQPGRTLALVVLDGTVVVNGSRPVGAAEWALLARDGADVLIEAHSDANVLLLSGEPLHEPVVGQGPFVMNTQREIATAIADFNAGRFGRMPH